MEIHVAWRVDEVEHVGLAGVLVLHGDGGGLDGDAALALDVHAVEDLVLGLRAAVIVPVSSSMRSASVLLPWSMWAMIEKFRMC